MTRWMMAGAILFASLTAANASSIWDGVYTSAQAARGETAYFRHCARCHGDDLDGGDEVTALHGAHFMVDFDTQTLADLTRRTQVTMPMETPGALDIATVTNIVTFLLRENGVPSGAQELPADLGAQSLIRFDAAKK